MIPIFDIKRQNKIIGKELKLALLNAVDSGSYILGSRVSEFEKAFTRYLGVKYAVGVACGTDAISLALLALGIKPGDGVILPANSYPSVFAVTAIGAVPQLVDIDPVTYNIDPLLIPGAITKKTKAIMPVHLYGQPADMERILAIGKEFNIPIIEDCAQAAGATLSVARPALSAGAEVRKSNAPQPFRMNPQGEPPLRLRGGEGELQWSKVGTIGDLGCFSFYPTKNLGCFGDGGMVVTNNPELAEKVRMLRMYGEKKRYKSILLGRNSRLDEIQAAILLVKLKYLDKWNQQRREIAKQYLSFRKLSHPIPLLIGEGKGEVFQFPYEATYTNHIYHLFVIRTKKRDKLKAYLAKKGIQTAIHYPTSIHLVPSMKYLGFVKSDFPESEKACREVLSLPMFPELNQKEVEAVVEVLSHFN